MLGLTLRFSRGFAMAERGLEAIDGPVCAQESSLSEGYKWECHHLLLPELVRARVREHRLPQQTRKRSNQ